MIQIVDPSCLLWAVLRLYITTLICLIPLSICLLYSLLRLLKCNDASEASVLCSLAGCAFYGIVISSLWKEDIESSSNNNKNNNQQQPTIILQAYKLVEDDDEYDDDDDDCDIVKHSNHYNDHSSHLRTMKDLMSVSSSAAAAAAASCSSTCSSSTCSSSSSSSSILCPICLEEYCIGDVVSFGEQCNHSFHSSCITQWTSLYHTGCPCCRQHLLKQQTSPTTTKIPIIN